MIKRVHPQVPCPGKQYGKWALPSIRINTEEAAKPRCLGRNDSSLMPDLLPLNAINRGAGFPVLVFSRDFAARVPN